MKLAIKFSKIVRIEVYRQNQGGASKFVSCSGRAGCVEGAEKILLNRGGKAFREGLLKSRGAETPLNTIMKIMMCLEDFTPSLNTYDENHYLP